MPTTLIPTWAAVHQDSTPGAQPPPLAFTATTDVGRRFHVIPVGGRSVAHDVYGAVADPPPVAGTGESYHRLEEADVLEVRARRM